MKSFFLKPLIIHLFFIFIAYSIIFIPSFHIYIKTNNSFKSYEEFLAFETTIFSELNNFQNNILKKDDLEYIHSYERINKIKYLENIQSIFNRYINEIEKFNADNLDDQLAALNIKIKQVTSPRPKMLRIHGRGFSFLTS